MKGGLRPGVASDDLGVPQRTGLDSLGTDVGVGVTALRGDSVVRRVLSSLEDNLLSSADVCVKIRVAARKESSTYRKGH